MALERKGGKGGKFEWPPELEQWLRDNYKTMTNKEMAAAKDIKIQTLRVKLYEMGLYRMELEYWTDEQVASLKEMYSYIGDKELAQIFDEAYPKTKGWTLKHIEKKRKYLGLKRTPEQLKAIKDRNIEFGCFSYNHWRRWADRTTPAGDIRMWNGQNGRQFMVIKLKDGFVHYARWLWQQVYGPITDGRKVRLRDNNPYNVVLSNLMLVTNSENQLLNAELRSGLPQEIKEVKKLTRLIDKKIKEYEKQNK